MRRRIKRGGDRVQLVAPAAYLPVGAQLGQHACRLRPRRLAPAPNKAQEWVQPDRLQRAALARFQALLVLKAHVCPTLHSWPARPVPAPRALSAWAPQTRSVRLDSPRRQPVFYAPFRNPVP